MYLGANGANDTTWLSCNIAVDMNNLNTYNSLYDKNTLAAMKNAYYVNNKWFGFDKVYDIVGGVNTIIKENTGFNPLAQNRAKVIGNNLILADTTKLTAYAMGSDNSITTLFEIENATDGVLDTGLTKYAAMSATGNTITILGIEQELLGFNRLGDKYYKDITLDPRYYSRGRTSSWR